MERRFDVLRRLTGLEKMGSAFVERCLDAWSSLRAGAHPAVRAAIEAHLGRSPLVRDLR